MNYLAWSIVALACYSVVAPLVSFVTRDVPSHVAAFVTNALLVLAALALVVYRGDPLVSYVGHPKMPYMLLAGVFLAVGILAYYRALALGPVSVVVPIFGLFIATSSAIGVVALDESLTVRKGVGIGFALLAVYLTSVE